MTTIEFLSRVLPELPPPQVTISPVSGSTFYAGTVNPVGYCAISLLSGTSAHNHYHIQSVQDLVRVALADSQEGRNAYFACASMTGARSKANAHSMKSLWADIDVGKASDAFGYPDRRTALDAIAKFVSQTQLYPTIIVSSGKGYHLYWTFHETLPASEWELISALFFELCQDYGLRVDPARACDAASVLRVPGTRHISSGNLVKVIASFPQDYNYQAFAKKAVALRKRTGKLVHHTTAHDKPKLNEAAYKEAVATGMAPPPDRDAERIKKECNQVAKMGQWEYPAWRGAMGVLSRTVNGKEVARQLSLENSELYSAEYFETVWSGLLFGIDISCNFFRKTNPDGCKECKHKCDSPVNIGMPGKDRYAVVEEKENADPRYATAPETPPAPPAEPVQEEEPAPPAEPVQEEDEVSEPQVISIDPRDMPKSTSPLMESLDKKEQRVSTLNMANWVVDNRGIVHLSFQKEPDGSWSQREDVIITSRIEYKYTIFQHEDGVTRRRHVFQIVHPDNKEEEAVLDIEHDLSSTQIGKWFAHYNMYQQSKTNSGLLMDFINAYLANIVHTSSSKELSVVDQYGWQDYLDPQTREKHKAFVCGRGAITSDGLKAVRFGAKADFLAKDLESKGDLQTWKAIPHMYKVLDQKVGQLAMCMSFAAPFMCYGSGEATNGILSLWSSQSGLGKTHVLRFAASVWGNPYEQFVSREASSVARTRRMSILYNLPVFMDEFTDVPDEDIYSLAYTLIGGKEKDKLKSSGDSYVQTGKWKTITFTTSNRSLKDAISRRAGDSDATLLRVMEYECDFKSYEDNPEMNRYITDCIALLREHYGLAGPELVYQIMRRPERLATLANEVSYWVSKKGFKNAERFLAYPLGIAIKVGRWAVEFGILDYDMDALEDWVCGTFVHENREDTENFYYPAKDRLAGYILDRTSDLLSVISERRPDDMKDPQYKGLPDNYILSAPKSDRVYMRLERDNHTLLIAKGDFSKWCKHNNCSAKTVVYRLKQEGVDIQETQRDLASYISWLPAMKVRCYVINTDQLGTNFNTEG